MQQKYVALSAGDWFASPDGEHVSKVLHVKDGVVKYRQMDGLEAEQFESVLAGLIRQGNLIQLDPDMFADRIIIMVADVVGRATGNG